MSKKLSDLLAEASVGGSEKTGGYGENNNRSKKFVAAHTVDDTGLPPKAKPGQFVAQGFKKAWRKADRKDIKNQFPEEQDLETDDLIDQIMELSVGALKQYQTSSQYSISHDKLNLHKRDKRREGFGRAERLKSKKTAGERAARDKEFSGTVEKLKAEARAKRLKKEEVEADVIDQFVESIENLVERLGLADHVNNAINATGASGTSHDRVEGAMRKVRESAPSHIDPTHPAMKHIGDAHKALGGVKPGSSGNEHYSKVQDHLVKAHSALLTKEEIELMSQQLNERAGRPSSHDTITHDHAESHYAMAMMHKDKKFNDGFHHHMSQYHAVIAHGSKDPLNKKSHAALAKAHKSRMKKPLYESDDAEKAAIADFANLQETAQADPVIDAIPAKSTSPKTLKTFLESIKPVVPAQEDKPIVDPIEQILSHMEAIQEAVDLTGLAKPAAELHADLEKIEESTLQSQGPFSKAMHFLRKAHLAQDCGWMDKHSESMKKYHGFMVDHHNAEAAVHGEKAK